MKDPKLRRLVAIADMIKDRDLSVLAEKKQAMELAVNAQRELLNVSMRECDRVVSDIDYRREVEDTVRVWRNSELHRLSHHSARLAALVEAQKLVASRSFGRSMALRSLIDSQKG